MSWLFSQALVAEYSAGTCSDGGQSVLSSETPMLQAYWSHDKTMEPSRRSRSGMTCAHLTASHGKALLTSYRAASRARTLASTARATGSKASGQDSGRKCKEFAERWGPERSSWRIRPCLFPEDSPLFSGIWPTWGTMRSGVVYPLMTWEPRTEERGSGSWHTPTASDAKGTCANSKFGQRRHQFTVLSQGRFSDGSIYPNPLGYEALMGWPLGWTALDALATDRFHEWQRQHSIFCQREGNDD
jgi:hypothetical protein